MSTSVASNDKGGPWQNVDRSYGFAIFNDKDKEKFMPTRFYNTPVWYVLTCMYAHPSGTRVLVPGSWYLVPVLELHNDYRPV